MKNGAVQNTVIEIFEELNFYEKCLTALQMPLNRANTSKPEKYTSCFFENLENFERFESNLESN